MKLLLKMVTLILLPFIVGKTVHDASTGKKGSNNEVILPYPEHIAGAYTGGFGEESCHSCHFDYELNQSEGELSVSGIPDSYEPGQEYEIQITVKRAEMNRAGFQLTSRFEDNTQAGSFVIHDNLSTTPDIENNITYVQHGVGKVESDGSEKSWYVTWVAPNQTDKKVIFNIAANAANGDASEFGDWIYLKEIETAGS